MAEPSADPKAVSTHATTPASRHVVAGETIDLFHRLLTLIDIGRREALRKQYIEMLGVRHLDDLQQDKLLIANRAYARALEEVGHVIDRDKKMVRELFDRAAAGPKPMKPADSPALQLRRERLNRLRAAQAERARRVIGEYDGKKRLYESRFETIEADAYAKGQARIDEDRRRYEELSAEFDSKLKQEQDAIVRAQEALEKIERVRETAERDAASARKVEEEIKGRINELAGQLKSALPGLEMLAEKLVPPAEQA